MHLFFLFFILTFTPSLAMSRIIKLLEIPLDDGTKYTYSVYTKKKCSFIGVKEIITPKILAGTENGVILEKINLIQKKINLDINTSEFTPKHIVFSLKGATNINFEFFFNKACILQKRIHVEETTIPLKEMKIEYSNALITPVIKKIIVKTNDKNSDFSLYPWALRGQISTYELSVGPAFNIHSNIRKDSLNRFEKNDPVIEPIPAFLFRYGTIFLNKDGLGSLLYHQSTFNLLGFGILEGEPYSATGLHERKKGFFLGGIAQYQMVELIFYKDFFKNKGTSMKLNLAPEYFPKLDWKIIPQFYVQYWDRNYVDYYFGVHPDEVTSERKAFIGKSTFNSGTMIEAMHFVDKWTFVLDVGIKLYGTEVYASPTVVRSNELRFITGILYKFF